MKTFIHAIAGTLALITLVTFWTSSIFVEIFGSTQNIASIKTGILYGLIILIPTLMITGGSGFFLAGGRKARILEDKKKRMKIIAFNGVIFLFPSALFLAFRAQAFNLDTWFYGVQAVELIAGLTNISLLFMNMKAGIKLSRNHRNVHSKLTT